MAKIVHEPRTSRVTRELESGATLSIVSLVDALIEEAYQHRASDIHIDPRDKELSVRMRIDGVLQDMHAFPKEIQSEVVTRIKVLSGLRTDEHQTAQDGRFRIAVDDIGPIDVRVSIMPTHYGENAVLRLLAEQSEKFGLEALGYSDEDRAKVSRAIKHPYGMILATGPTGSGKTTTIYSIVKQLNSKEVSIVTIEDPIEYAIGGVNQIQVNSRTGLSFAHGLRSILRQDPDIIMVGEIRDAETARLAVNSALTGHLVLSTLHTNDAAGTLPRLLDLGIEPYLITATVNVAIGQRLVRKICPSCKTLKKLTKDEAKSLAEVSILPSLDAGTPVYRGAGCGECGESGYRGRIGIYEVLVVDDVVRELMLQKHSASDIKTAAKKHGMTNMIEDGFKKVMAGITTIEEVLRVVHE